MKQKKNNPQHGSFHDSVHMEISGNRRIILEGCRGILDYGDELIRLSTGQYLIVLRGRGLRIQCMNANDLVITGFVTGLEYQF